MTQPITSNASFRAAQILLESSRLYESTGSKTFIKFEFFVVKIAIFNFRSYKRPQIFLNDTFPIGNDFYSNKMDEMNIKYSVFAFLPKSMFASKLDYPGGLSRLPNPGLKIVRR